MCTGDSTVSELKWLAYMAQELGWDSLASRIASDAIAIQSRSSVQMMKGQQNRNAPTDWSLSQPKNHSWSEANDNSDSFHRLEDLDNSWREAADALEVITQEEEEIDERWAEINGAA